MGNKITASEHLEGLDKAFIEWEENGEKKSKTGNGKEIAELFIKIQSNPHMKFIAAGRAE